MNPRFVLLLILMVSVVMISGCTTDNGYIDDLTETENYTGEEPPLGAAVAIGRDGGVGVG